MKIMPKTIEEIKSYLDGFVGKPMYLRANIGQRKSIEAEGILVETYPKLFVMKLDNSNAVRRHSYTYADILTKNVEVIPKG